MRANNLNVDPTAIHDTYLYGEGTDWCLYRGFYITTSTSGGGYREYSVSHPFINKSETSLASIMNHLDKVSEQCVIVGQEVYLELPNDSYMDIRGNILKNRKVVDQTFIEIGMEGLNYYNLGSYYSTDFPLKLSMRGKLSKMISPSGDYSQLAVM